MQKRILIVEDEAIVAESIRVMVERIGYCALGVALSEAAAWEIVHQERPDLVFMDIHLGPGRDGIAFAESLRQRYGLPVVYLTAYADEATIQRAKLTHPFGYVTKPFDERDLKVAIEIALHNHQMELRLQDSQRALRASEQRFRDIYRESPIAIELYDGHGMLMDVNPACCALFGIESADAVREFNLLQDPNIPSDQMERLKAGQAVRFEAEFDFDLVTERRLYVTTRHGKVVLDILVTPICDEARILSQYLVQIIDITERERLQAQLAQAQKMESVGRLAGGVAHDFNNMLGAILGNASYALQSLPENSPLREELEEIQKCAQRSAELTRQLLAFARKQTSAPKVLDLNAAVDGTLKMLRRLIGENIEFTWSPSADVWPVKIDPSQIDQILANLCVNARDAIHGEGKVILRTANAKVDEPHAAKHPGVSPGDYVLLSVSDNGCGMDEETLDHVFEPFFTTKGASPSTGLGLATVYGTVRQNGGFVDVQSKPAQGTTFALYLPRHVAQTAPNVTISPPPAAGRQQETILLVEDEPALLRISKRALEALGYRVLAAAKPAEAIGLAEAHGRQVALLITDVVMPEMNGRELAKRLVGLYPGLKRLFISGYTADAIACDGVLEEGLHFLQKPFTMQALAEKVRETLETP
jgi:two-component system, cell cycle sensor histidine kinase and response regulator CckA